MDIVVADDQDEVRSALRLILEDEPGLRVSSEARRAEDLLPAVAQIEAGLLILDWELPGLRPAELSRVLRDRRPGLKVIALSGWPEAQRAALDAGADAFVSKCDPPEQLLRVVRAICGGRGCS